MAIYQLPRSLSLALPTNDHDTVLAHKRGVDASPALDLVSGRGPVAGPVLWPRIAALVAVHVSQIPWLLRPDRFAAAGALDLAASNVASPAVSELLVIPAVAPA